jgi:hypothetical protein
MYTTAFGVTQDHAQALRWLPLAAATESPSVFAAFRSGGCCAASIPTTTMYMHAMQIGNRGASDAAQVDGSARCVRCFLLQLSIYQTPYGHKNKQINHMNAISQTCTLQKNLRLTLALVGMQVPTAENRAPLAARSDAAEAATTPMAG